MPFAYITLSIPGIFVDILLVGADNSKEDGVYSGYFYQYEGSGAYSMRAFARGVQGVTTILRETRELVYEESEESYQGTMLL